MLRVWIIEQMDIIWVINVDLKKYIYAKKVTINAQFIKTFWTGYIKIYKADDKPPSPTRSL